MTITAIKSSPILFSGAMVRAILDGSKTQTRRVIKPQPLIEQGVQTVQGETYDRLFWSKNGSQNPFGSAGAFFSGNIERFPVWMAKSGVCPYGKAGDRLWVREACYQGQEKLWYKADIEDLSRCGIKGWKPSIHMPRAACRITLEVTEVRVQRLQDITEADAIAEGIDPYCGADYQNCFSCKHRSACQFDGQYRDYSEGDDGFPLNPKESFKTLWNSINGTKHPWKDNPWVWTVSFKRVEVSQ